MSSQGHRLAVLIFQLSYHPWKYHKIITCHWNAKMCHWTKNILQNIYRHHTYTYKYKNVYQFKTSMISVHDRCYQLLSVDTTFELRTIRFFLRFDILLDGRVYTHTKTGQWSDNEHSHSSFSRLCRVRRCSELSFVTALNCGVRRCAVILRLDLIWCYLQAQVARVAHV